MPHAARRGIYGIIATGIPFLFPALVSAQVSHSCVANCGGGSAPSGGGGYVAPAPRGPTPAQIEAQRRNALMNAANEKGNAAADRKDWNAAVQYYREALSYQSNPVVQGNLARALAGVEYTKGAALSLSNPHAAIGHFEQALRTDPNNKFIRAALENARTLAANKLGNAAFERGDYEAAVRYYRSALQHAPNDSVVRQNLERAEQQGAQIAAFKAEH